MRLDLDDQQRELQAAVRRFCEHRFPVSVARAYGLPGGFDRGRWRELADLGVFALHLDDAHGGAGLGTVEAALVFEVLGGALVPGPLVACHLAAEVDERVAAGELVAAIIDRSASPLVAEHLRDADVAFVIDADCAGVSRLSAADLRFQELEPFDPTTPVARVDLDGVGEPVGDAALATDWRRRGSLLSSALLVGLAASSSAVATEYAKQREQFDRPIGSFQAIQHMLADTFARTEVARAAVYAAAAMTDHPEGMPVARAVAAARVVAAQAGIANAKTCVQVHGGMGFTWEVDAHLYLKRAWVTSSAFGSADDAAEVVASHLV